MPEQHSPEYTMGYGEDFMQLLDRRKAESHAAYLLPRLESGMRVLDFGCGPGTISVGLARAVEPGEFHGIDMEESQIGIARAAAQAGGHANATFHVGDVTNLPFEDGYFDVAHCHTLLTHVPDTQKALAEVKRVLKPGGLIGAREMNGGSSFMAPDWDDEGWRTFMGLIEANGGHPNMGRELKDAFLQAGFVSPVASASFDFFTHEDDIAFFHGFSLDWFFTPRIIEAATMFGFATKEQFEQWRRDLDEWKNKPSATAAIGFGECIATKP